MGLRYFCGNKLDRNSFTAEVNTLVSLILKLVYSLHFLYQRTPFTITTKRIQGQIYQ